MARLPRAVAVDTPHHVTQRGNARRFILESDSARLVYLQLLQHACRLHRLSLLGYCLMSNHVHLIAIPQRPDSLAMALKQVHGRYAAYFNALHASSGHVWQGRYYSCALDPPHLWAALRYTELNPVRAGLVAEPEAFPWSSATAHCLPAAQDPLLDLALRLDPISVEAVPGRVGAGGTGPRDPAEHSHWAPPGLVRLRAPNGNHAAPPPDAGEGRSSAQAKPFDRATGVRFSTRLIRKVTSLPSPSFTPGLLVIGQPSSPSET